MRQYTKDEEIELLRKQLVACTTAMREVAGKLRDLGGDATTRMGDECERLANTLELARSKPVWL